MAAAAMTMAIARREPNYYMAGFAAASVATNTGAGTRYWNVRANPRMAPLDITASDSLASAMQKAHS